MVYAKKNVYLCNAFAQDSSTACLFPPEGLIPLSTWTYIYSVFIENWLCRNGVGERYSDRSP